MQLLEKTVMNHIESAIRPEPEQKEEDPSVGVYSERCMDKFGVRIQQNFNPHPGDHITPQISIDSGLSGEGSNSIISVGDVEVEDEDEKDGNGLRIPDEM